MPPNNQQDYPAQVGQQFSDPNYTQDSPQQMYATQQQAQPSYPPITQQIPTQPQPAQQVTHTKVVPKQNSTQNSLLISEIRDGMVIMGDGSFRAVVACESINFDLMSSREREGVEYSYQNFLNSLFFPIQIFIRSQRVDIGPYLDKLEALRRSQDNMLLGVLMDDYIQFIDILSQEANIMDKSFFIVIPYYPVGDVGAVVKQSKGILSKLLGSPSTPANKITRIDKSTYDKAKEELSNRVNAVTSSLAQVGIPAVQLSTKELGELYYNVYNPDTAVREPLGDFSKVTSTYVRRGQSPIENQTQQSGVMHG